MPCCNYRKCRDHNIAMKKVLKQGNIYPLCPFNGAAPVSTEGPATDGTLARAKLRAGAEGSLTIGGSLITAGLRSEERRVGKEC